MKFLPVPATFRKCSFRQAGKGKRIACHRKQIRKNCSFHSNYAENRIELSEKWTNFHAQCPSQYDYQSICPIPIYLSKGFGIHVAVSCIFAPPKKVLSTMISRRNIRVKVMQTLYTCTAADGSITKEASLRTLENHLDQSRQLFITLTYILTETARYAERDALQKASKYLPTSADLNVNVKIAGNEVLWKILEHPSYQQALKEIKPERFGLEDWIRKLYNELTDSEVYKQYIAKPERNKKEEKEILEFIFTDLMLPNENLESQIEELFLHWEDDCEMMNLLMLNFLQKPQTYNFQNFVTAEKMKYARELLISVIEKESVCSDLISSKLQNWDPERTALLDMILMRMGICEFLYFETIPPKVTINECIDLAKDYSTPQSGHFVNGILDSIHKELATQNKLHKVTFKKS
jgi:N utilization substance protein B